MRQPSSVLLLAAISAAALGCGSTAATPTGVASLPADFTGPGVYTVPAVPSAQFAIAKVRIEQADDDAVSIYYDLPADLAGETVHVELDGKLDGAGSIQLSGMMGTSTCTVSPGELLCEEHLTGLHGQYPSSSLAPSGPQRSAAESFITDPIGRLRVTLPM